MWDEVKKKKKKAAGVLYQTLFMGLFARRSQRWMIDVHYRNEQTGGGVARLALQVFNLWRNKVAPANQLSGSVRGSPLGVGVGG